MVAKGYYDQTRSATYQYHHNSTTNCNVTAYELGYHIYLEQIVGSHFWKVQPLPSPTLLSALEPVLSSSIMNHHNAKGSDTSQNSLPSVRDSDTKRFVFPVVAHDMLCSNKKVICETISNGACWSMDSGASRDLIILLAAFTARRLMRLRMLKVRWYLLAGG
jgi:hypothetical protein